MPQRKGQATTRVNKVPLGRPDTPTRALSSIHVGKPECCRIRTLPLKRLVGVLSNISSAQHTDLRRLYEELWVQGKFFKIVLVPHSFSVPRTPRSTYDNPDDLLFDAKGGRV